MAWNTAYADYTKFSSTTKVGFLQGTQASLETLITNGGAQEGTFYLTSDSQRLYVGRTIGNKTIPVPVNEGIHVVANVNSLPAASSVNAGEFYYATAENVLCIAGQNVSGKDTWIQLNKIATLTQSAANISVAESSGTITVSDTISDSLGNQSTGNFKIKAGANITVTGDSNNREITISTGPNVDTHYTLSAEDGASGANAVAIKLTDDKDGEPDVINILGSTNAHVEYTAPNSITITTDDSKMASISPSFGADGKLNIIATTNKTGSGSVTGNVTPKISIGVTDSTLGSVSGKTEAVFASGIASLDVYTAAQVDKLIENELQGFDAMQYCGTITNKNSIPTITTLHNGDVYKIAGSGMTYGDFAGNSGTQPVRTGDLIIAHGTEDSNGLLTSAATFDIIPAGDDQSIGGNATASGMTITDGSTTLAGFTLGAGNDGVSVSGTVSNKITALKVSHKTVSVTPGSGTNGATAGTKSNGTTPWTFSTIKNVTLDDYGHVTGYDVVSGTINDTHNRLTGMISNLAQTTPNRKVTISKTWTDSDGSGMANQAPWAVSSETLNLTADVTNKVLAVELNWGTF